MQQEALNVIGSKYKGFTVTKHLPLSELQSTLVELVHDGSGARVIHIANSDPENLFCLSLQTLPDSSNGVAHILEHTVLCGSKKFPVKDPFFAMTRRSLNTFMNAMTGQDFTCYPASSQVEKDFYNLFEVYLDAVFYPELKRLSFLQEGHRLEFRESKNPKSPLQFQGIVYNEMKGNLSSSDSRLWNAIFKHLCSDLPYAHNTGGDPKEIPSLSFEELTEFHKNFYNPSRCLFFFYGNLPLSKHLSFLEEKVLNGAPKLAPLPPLPRQTRFTAPISEEDTYPIQESEGLKKKAILSFSWLTVPVTHPGEVLALALLDSLLMDNDASPLRHALLKSKLCTQAIAYLDIEMSEVPWLIICKGCERENREPLRELLFKTLKEIASKGFSSDEIEASLHQLEFDRTEINTDEGPFGLTLFMRAALVTQHGSDAENGLLIHTLFKELREKMKNPDYLPSLIRHHLIDNPHFLAHMFAADKDLGKKEDEEEKKRLEAIQSRLSEKEAMNIIADSEALASYQEKTEHQSLDCLPKVSLSDIPPLGKDLALEETKSAHMSIFHHPCFTNQILYADLVFDLPKIPFSDLPLSSLLVRFLTEVGCGGQSYEKTLHDSLGYTGGLSASLSLHVNHLDPDKSFPSLSIKGKALSRNSGKLFELFANLIASPDFSDAKRIKELLSQHATSLQNGMAKNGLKYATQISLSPFSSASTIYNEWNGIPYYAAVMKWVQNPDALIDDLLRLKSQILNVGTPALVLSCSEDEIETLKKADFHGLGNKIGGKPYEKWTGDYPLAPALPQARFISSPVAFTSLGTRTASYTDPASPLLLLSTELFQNVILHNEIREKGGAYGSGASYAASTGNFYFYSYRDPHLAKTVATFEKAIEKMAQGKFTEENLEEAKFGVFQTIDAPIVPGSRAMTAYSWKRSGRTPEMRDAFRSKLLNATSKEVANAVETHLLPTKKILVSFLGEALFEKEKGKLKQMLDVFPLES